MNRLAPLLLLALLAPVIVPPAARGAIGPLPMTDPNELCRRAIEAAERAHSIPLHLLAAIARVESGRRDPASGTVNPWPWTINADGQGNFYDDKAQAVAAAQARRSRVNRSIDVGCMQISLTHHPDAFANLEQAFDPAANADYAARFLLQLYDKSGSWPKAVGLYHSATPDLGSEYQAKVYATLPQEQKLASLSTPLSLAKPWAPTWIRAPISTALLPPVGHIIPQAPGLNGFTAPGRSLDSYRSMPVRIALRAP